MPSPDRLRAKHHEPESHRPHSPVWQEGVGFPDITQAADASSDWCTWGDGSDDRSRMSLCPVTSQFCCEAGAHREGVRASTGAQAEGILGGTVRHTPPQLETTDPHWQGSRGTLQGEDGEPLLGSMVWVHLADVTLSESYVPLRSEAGDLSAR